MAGFAGGIRPLDQRLHSIQSVEEVYLDIEWEGLLVERAYRMDLVVS